MPNKFFTQTAGTPGQLGQTSFLDALKKQIEEKEKQNEVAVKANTEIAEGKTAPATFIQMEQGQTTVKTILDEMTRLARTRNEDPAAVAEAQIASESIGKTMLRDFLLGASAVNGGPVENTRSILMKRSLLAQEMRQKQLEALQGATKNFIDADNNIRTTAASELATRQKAASALQDTTAQDGITKYNTESAIEFQKLQNAKELETFKSKLAVSEKERFPSDVEAMLAPITAEWVEASSNPESTPEEIAKARTKMDLAMDAMAEFTKAKTAKVAAAASASGAAPSPFKYDTKAVEYPVGMGKVKILETVGEDGTGNASLNHSYAGKSALFLSPEWIKARDMANERIGLLGELEKSFYSIPSASIAGLVGKMQDYQVQLRSLGTLATEEDGRKMIENLDGKISRLNLTGPEANFIQNYNRLVAATVRAFTGAQATDAERQFIQTTLPAMFGDATSFAIGLSKLSLATEWMEYKIRNQLHHDDNKVADAGEFFGEVVNQWESAARGLKLREGSKDKSLYEWVEVAGEMKRRVPDAVLTLKEWDSLQETGGNSAVEEKWKSLSHEAQRNLVVEGLAGQWSPAAIAEKIGAKPWTAIERKLF